MAKTSQIVKSRRSRVKAKFSTRVNRRCWKCGRGHGYMRDFELCRICFRELASKGDIPGIRKSSW
ncbi:MAG: type Z 30S ribosomal protein S14 [Candidatus Kerfeldbacteria bacterium]|nr:type Z 30S ribosomal protein S14 [Candidatus Kerfeldbacteria bacterium]